MMQEVDENLFRCPHRMPRLIVALAFLACCSQLRAGTWALVGTNFFGSASGTASPTGIAANSVNADDISNTSITFLRATQLINMFSTISNPEENSAQAHALTSKAEILFNFWYTPAPGKTFEEDPPGPTLTVVLTLARTQHVKGNSGAAPATISAYAKVMGDDIIFPDLTGSEGGSLVHFAPPDVVETIKIIKILPVNNSQLVTLSVNLKTETEAKHLADAFGEAGMLGPVVDVVGNSQIVPTANLLDIVLIVPDPKVFPETFPIYPYPHTDGRNRYVFNTASTGVLVNPDWQARVIGGDPNEFLPNTTFTSFDVGSSVRTNDAISVSGADIIRQHFTYTGLPADSTDFGNKKVVLNCTGPVVSTQTARVQVFFPKTATNHPNPDAPTVAGRTPNWFFFWRQTSAGSGFQDNYYGGNAGALPGATVWTGSAWISMIYNAACGSSSWWAGTQQGTTDGIDLFAITVRHEQRHLEDDQLWWPPPNGLVWPNSNDLDRDGIPTAFGDDPNFEYHRGLEYHPGTGYLPGMHLTTGIADEFSYGPLLNDGEDYCEHRQVTWTKGAANREDWAKPGKQWN